MDAIRVLVVDDSALMRRIITDILQSDPSIQVTHTARNGQEALKLLEQHPYDVITLDIEMPVMTGLETLPLIIKDYRIPVIMLSSLTSEGATHTIQALEIGAFDFVTKPSGSISLDLAKVSDDLLAKVKVAAVSKSSIRTPFLKTVEPIKTAEWRTRPLVPVATEKSRNTKNAETVNEIVAIGTSTGGPRALHVVLSQLPEHYSASVVIVQHMPPNFTKSLADRLNQLSKVQVVEAEHGQKLQPGTVYIAPGDYHMEVLQKGIGHFIIELHQAAPVSGHRPSVDVLFRSVAKLEVPLLQGVIMTGMGSDGAQGMVLLKEKGARTIAESEETCVVYGMPRSAVAKSCIDWVLPLDQIATRLITL